MKDDFLGGKKRYSSDKSRNGEDVKNIRKKFKFSLR